MTSPFAACGGAFGFVPSFAPGFAAPARFAVAGALAAFLGAVEVEIFPELFFAAPSFAAVASRSSESAS